MPKLNNETDLQYKRIYKFFNEHDQRRGTDFLKTFPEMETWWKECEQHAKK